MSLEEMVCGSGEHVCHRNEQQQMSAVVAVVGTLFPGSRDTVFSCFPPTPLFPFYFSTVS